MEKKELLEELVTVKSELQASLKKSLDETIKTEIKAAVDEINEKIKGIKELPTDFDAAKVAADLKTFTADFDALQLKVKEMKMASPAGKEEESFIGKLNAAILGWKDNITAGRIAKGVNTAKIELKAVGDMTIAANLTGSIPNTYRTEIVPVPFEMVHLRSLVAVTPSETDSYHFYRHVIGEGSIEFQNQELETKSQFDEDLTEQTVNLNYLAGWLRISRKMLRNFKGLQGYLSRWLPERYYEREDTKGYQALISGATGVADTTGTDIISTIIRTIGLQKKAKYNVNGIVIDGAVWAKILTYKASTSGEFTQPIGVVTISPAGQLMICGVPVYTASWVGGDQAIIGDWRNFEIIQSESLSLQFFEQDGTNVRENKITVRIEASIGFCLLDPKAFAVASLASVS